MTWDPTAELPTLSTSMGLTLRVYCTSQEQIVGVPVAVPFPPCTLVGHRVPLSSHLCYLEIYLSQDAPWSPETVSLLKQKSELGTPPFQGEITSSINLLKPSC